MTRAGHRTISVPEALYDRVAALAEELDLTVPQITRRALNSYLAAAAAAAHAAASHERRPMTGTDGHLEWDTPSMTGTHGAAAELNPKEPTS